MPRVSPRWLLGLVGFALALGVTDHRAALPELAARPGPVAVAELEVADASGPEVAAAPEVDTREPELILTAPAEAFFTGETEILVSGYLTEAGTVEIGSSSMAVEAGAHFSFWVPLVEGPNILLLTATDLAGNFSVIARSGFSDPSPPPALEAALVATSRDGDTVNIAGAAGAAESGARVRWRTSRSGATGETVAAADGSFVVVAAAGAAEVVVAAAVDALDRPGPELEIRAPMEVAVFLGLGEEERLRLAELDLPGRRIGPPSRLLLAPYSPAFAADAQPPELADFPNFAGGELQIVDGGELEALDVPGWQAPPVFQQIASLGCYPELGYPELGGALSELHSQK